MAWGLVGLRLLLVAGVWGFRFCCAARGVMPLGGGGIVTHPCKCKVCAWIAVFFRAWPLWPAC